MEQTAIDFSIQNRNRAYHSLELGTRQKAVLEVIKKYQGISNREIALIMGVAINCVTGRVKELNDIGYVTIAGKKLDEVTHKTVTLWRAV